MSLTKTVAPFELLTAMSLSASVPAS